MCMLRQLQSMKSHCLDWPWYFSCVARNAGVCSFAKMLIHETQSAPIDQSAPQPLQTYGCIAYIAIKPLISSMQFHRFGFVKQDT